jgi:curved DNA-binding protein CbpA
LRKSDFIMAAKMLKKSLQLYPLPGVEALAAHATSKLAEQNTTRNQTSNASPAANDGGSSHRRSDAAAAASANGNNNSNNGHGAAAAQQQQRMGEDGRSYTAEQHEIVHKVIRSKQGGRGAHYRVLGIAQSANEAEIKRAYRKLSLKVHPDKNSAPGANDAFKSVSLAYATLSDEQKRTMYDRFGDEDPDENRPPGRGPGGGVHMRHGGQEMSPEDIFNAFFNGHMGGGGFGGNGMHFYTNGFGPGSQFRPQQRREQQRPQQQGQQQQQQNTGFAALFQLLPILFFLVLSLLSSSGGDGTSSMNPGEGKYFMLTVRFRDLCAGCSYFTSLPSFSCLFHYRTRLLLPIPF